MTNGKNGTIKMVFGGAGVALLLFAVSVASTTAQTNKQVEVNCHGIDDLKLEIKEHYISIDKRLWNLENSMARMEALGVYQRGSSNATGMSANTADVERLFLSPNR